MRGSLKEIKNLEREIEIGCVVSPRKVHFEREGYGGWIKDGKKHTYDPITSRCVEDQPAVIDEDKKRLALARLEEIAANSNCLVAGKAKKALTKYSS